MRTHLLRKTHLLAASIAVFAAIAFSATNATAEVFPPGYFLDVEASRFTTSSELGGSGQLTASNANYGAAHECAPSSDGGPFSINHYPPLDCEQLGRPYNPPPNEFWYTGNQNCVTASQPLSGANFVWHAQLPHTGYWHVEIYIPNWTQYGFGNQYISTSADGQSENFPLTQQAYHGQWVNAFGPHRYDTGQEYTVELTLADGSDAYCHYQTADQVKWVYDGPSSPSATISLPANGGTYPQNAIVHTSFACTPAFSEALESCTDSNGGSGTAGTLDTTSTGQHTYTVTAKGVGGATGTAEISYTVMPTKLSCASDSARATYSPGLTDHPAVQRVKIKGKLSGCSGGGFTSAKYTAVLKTSGPITCATLESTEDEPAAGTVTIKWAAKTKKPKSIGSFELPITAAPEAAIGGELESGPFSPGTLYGPISQTFAAASSCGMPVKGKVKPLKKATLAGSPFIVY
jgi:hypothetical protein